MSEQVTAVVEDTALLSVQHLEVAYPGRGLFAKPVTIIDDVSFSIEPGETVGLVGESGSGKSTIGRALLGLAPTTGGEVDFDGVSLTGPDAAHARRDMQIVFQDPYGSLNPSHSIGAILREALQVRQGVSASEARERVEQMLRMVGLPADASERRPVGFSGGQRQRIGIARALVGEPRLVICDEATSALDLVTRHSVVRLLADLQIKTGVAYLFIAHDLPLVAAFADRVVVLYRGRIMEQGPADAVGEEPLHPYTRALVASVPTLDVDEQESRRIQRTKVVAGSTAAAAPVAVTADACPFAPRCPSAAAPCWSQRPRDVVVGDRTLACHLFDPEVEMPETAQPSGAVSA